MKMPPERNYCPEHGGGHVGEPCRLCGWSQKDGFSKFLHDFIFYSDWFEKETNSFDGSWAWDFVGWIADKLD